MARIVCIWGPPCAGKTTLARQLKTPLHLLIERDKLHTALSDLESHHHTENGMNLVNAGYKAMLNAAIDLNGQFIFVTGAPTLAQRKPFIDAGAEMRLVYESRETCLQRAHNERPRAWSNYVDNWFTKYEQDQNLTNGVLI